MVGRVVRVIAFTDEELEEIQLTLADKILHLHRHQADSPQEDIAKELTTLRRVVEKCHNHWRAGRIRLFG